MKTKLLSVFFLLGMFSTSAQDCHELFKTAFAKMKASAAQATKGMSLKYNVQVQTASGEQYSDIISLEVKNKRFKVVSAQATIFQDDKTMVVIQPEEKVIFMSKPTSTVGSSRWADIVALLDSLVKHMIVKNCAVATDLTTANGLCRKIDFKLPTRIQEKMGITSVTYWIEENDATIRKVQIVYAKRVNQRLARLDFEFREMNFDYRSTPFEGTALGIVMEGRSNMKASYKNFKLIDNRR